MRKNYTRELETELVNEDGHRQRIIEKKRRKG